MLFHLLLDREEQGKDAGHIFLAGVFLGCACLWQDAGMVYEDKSAPVVKISGIDFGALSC